MKLFTVLGFSIVSICWQVSFAGDFKQIEISQRKAYTEEEGGGYQYMAMTADAERKLKALEGPSKCEADYSVQELRLTNSGGMTVPSIKIIKIWEVGNCTTN